jgi:hypothetical protein
MDRNNIKHLFVPYNLAIKLKDCGFNEPCLASYCSSHPEELIPYRGYPNDGDEDTSFSTTKNSGMVGWVTAPLYQQVEDWLASGKYDVIIQRNFNGFSAIYDRIKGLSIETHATEDDVIMAALELIKTKHSIDL